jgi:hypothetical protein
MPFHWGDLYAPGNAANQITNDVFDPVSKEPEYKACAVMFAKAVEVPANAGAKHGSHTSAPAPAAQVFNAKMLIADNV